MAFYMFQVAYTPESLAHQIQNPGSIVDRTKPLIEKLGGRLLSTYYCFGDYDLVQIVEFPDNVSAGSLPVTAYAGGALKAVKTTPLMTVAEGVAILKRAAAATIYVPPV